MPKKNGSPNLHERNTDPVNLFESRSALIQSVNQSDNNCSSADNTSDNTSDKPARFRNFLCEFYPDDDKHMKILHMLERYPQMFKIAYILHDKDVWSDSDIIKYKKKHNDDCPYNVGDSKKAHIHCLIINRSPLLASSMSRTLGGIHVEICRDVDASLRYFIHDTYESWDKFQYSPDKMFGDSKLISRLTQRNSDYIQLQTLCHLFDSENGLRSVIDYVAEHSQYQSTFERFQYMIVACNVDERSRRTSNQLINNYRGYNNETKN